MTGTTACKRFLHKYCIIENIFLQWPLQPFKRQSQKMVKHTQKIRRQNTLGQLFPERIAIKRSNGTRWCKVVLILILNELYYPEDILTE